MIEKTLRYLCVFIFCTSILISFNSQIFADSILENPYKLAMPRDDQEKIFEALLNKDINVIKESIAAGIDINSQREDGATLLHLAVSLGFSDIVEFLLIHGAEVNVQNEFGEVPLHLASLSDDPEECLKIARMLIDYQADIDITEDIYGSTPLFWQNLEVSELLVAKGAKIDFRRNDGMTPLFWHVYGDSNEVVEFLAKKGADIQYQLSDGQSLMHLASFLENSEVVQFLIRQGLDVNIIDEKGWTPLHMAAMQGNLDIIKILLQNGAKKNIKTSSFLRFFPKDLLPLDIAKKTDADKEILRILE